jgi:hypothetical protein
MASCNPLSDCPDDRRVEAQGLVRRRVRRPSAAAPGSVPSRISAAMEP